ncbi:MAG: potassium channel family protein [Caldilineales bacterium]|nr:potassium channel family protein [Caldilineales bacterium]
MAGKKREQRELKDIGYELFVGALSILSIVNLALLYLYPLDVSLQYILYTINAVMTPVFLGDFLYRFFTSPDRWRYFFRGFGWADLLSSLPLPQFKILRMFRLWRVIRLFREFGAKNLVREFVTHRAENALLTVVFLVLLVLEFGALAIIYTESKSADANIKDASDALWWTYVTITTVGYGDRYPVTNPGRLVGLFVMTAGVGLFGTLSGFLANKLLAPDEAGESDTSEADTAATASATTETAALADDAKARLNEIKRILDEQERATTELRAKLEEMGELL